MSNPKSLSALAGAGLGALTLAAPIAHATLFEDIGVPSAEIAAFKGPYVALAITEHTPNLATIVFTSRFQASPLPIGSNTNMMGGVGAADLNVNGAYTLGPVSEGNSFATFTPTFNDNTPGAMLDGFGSFNLSLNNVAGAANAATAITFDITNVTGLWTSDSAVLTANASGFNAAVDVYPCGPQQLAPCSPTSPNFDTTGFAANGPQAVPAPLIGRGVPILLAVVGVLFGAKLLERSKQRRSLGTAVPQAA
jgi:hypothetical protein